MVTSVKPSVAVAYVSQQFVTSKGSVTEFSELKQNQCAVTFR